MDEESSRDSEVPVEKVESSVEAAAITVASSVSSVPENWKEIDVKNDENKIVSEAASVEGIHPLTYLLTHSVTHLITRLFSYLLICSLIHRRKSSWWFYQVRHQHGSNHVWRRVWSEHRQISVWKHSHQS